MAKSFTVYEEYDKLMIFLTREEKANVVLSIWEYMFSNKKPILSERENAVFVNLKRPLDKSKSQSRKRQTKTETNPTETKTEPKTNPTETKTELKLNTSNDVDVYVSNYYCNNNYDVNGNVDVSNEDISNVPEDNLTIDDFIQVNIYSKIEKELCVLISSCNKTQIDEYLKIFSEDAILYAASKATAANVRKLSYVFAILDNWKDNKLFTLEKIKESESMPKKSKSKSNLDTFDKVVNNES